MTDFEPRSAKSADFEEITYTGTKDVAWSPGDEVPPGATIVDITDDSKLKEGEGRTFVARIDGVQKTLRARDGIFHPQDAEDDRALVAFGLPHARASKSEASDSKKGG